jgi:hypothetical protein
LFDSSDFNEDFVNKNYDWDAAIQRASGEQAGTFTEVSRYSNSEKVLKKLNSFLPLASVR